MSQRNPPEAGRPESARKLVQGTLSLAAAIAIAICFAPAAFAWGPKAHSLVNGWAVSTLPPGIRGFFEANRQFLTDHARDADTAASKNRNERELHYIYLDQYGSFPYLKLPHSYDQAVKQYGRGRITRDGVLPWEIGKVSLRLTEDFRANKWDDVKVDAALLAHLVADAHDPLHTTGNFDGQWTGEAGLAGRFETQLVNKFTNFFIFDPRAASKIADPTEYAFQMVLEANAWTDRIILADRQAIEGLKDYNEDYYDRFYSSAGPVIMRELNRAAEDAGSYWYTAWLNAGQPALPH